MGVENVLKKETKLILYRYMYFSPNRLFKCGIEPTISLKMNKPDTMIQIVSMNILILFSRVILDLEKRVR